MFTEDSYLVFGIIIRGNTLLIVIKKAWVFLPALCQYVFFHNKISFILWILFILFYIILYLTGFCPFNELTKPFSFCFQTSFPDVPSGIQEENGIKYKFQVFKKEMGDAV